VAGNRLSAETPSIIAKYERAKKREAASKLAMQVRGSLLDEVPRLA